MPIILISKSVKQLVLLHCKYFLCQNYTFSLCLNFNCKSTVIMAFRRCPNVDELHTQLIYTFFLILKTQGPKYRVQNIRSRLEKSWVSNQKQTEKQMHDLKKSWLVQPYIFQGFSLRKISGRPEKFDVRVQIYWATVYNSFTALSVNFYICSVRSLLCTFLGSSSKFIRQAELFYHLNNCLSFYGHFGARSMPQQLRMLQTKSLYISRAVSYFYEA